MKKSIILLVVLAVSLSFASGNWLHTHQVVDLYNALFSPATYVYTIKTTQINGIFEPLSNLSSVYVYIIPGNESGTTQAWYGSADEVNNTIQILNGYKWSKIWVTYFSTYVANTTKNLYILVGIDDVDRIIQYIVASDGSTSSAVVLHMLMQVKY